MISRKDHKKIEAQWLILRLIDQEKKVRKQDLIKKLDVSEKTIVRYINELSLAGFPIYEEKEGRYKVYKLRSETELPIGNLSLSEHITIILLGKMMYFPLQNTPFALYLESCIQKISSILELGQSQYIDQLFSIFSLHFAPILADKKVYQILEIFQKACLSKKRIWIKYYSANSGITTERKVDPLAIYHREQAFRLVANCHTSCKKKEFFITSCTRIPNSRGNFYK